METQKTHCEKGGNMRRTISFCLCAVVTILILLSSMAPRIAVADGQKQKLAPVGGNVLPEGYYITPTAAPGSTFQALATGLRSDGSANANGAVTTALSPDGTALLVLTSGYNKFFFSPDGTLITHPVLDPTTGKPSSKTVPQAEWVFVYDVRGTQPVHKQRINLPDTYHGLVWDPSGNRFYVSAGIDDRVYVYKASKTGPSADTTFVPDAPFVLLGHNSHQKQPLPSYDGGIFKNTPVNGSIGQSMFITPFS